MAGILIDTDGVECCCGIPIPPLTELNELLTQGLITPDDYSRAVQELQDTTTAPP